MTNTVLGAVEKELGTAAINIAEGAVSGGVAGAESAAIAEVEKVVVAVVSSRDESDCVEREREAAPTLSAFTLIEQWAKDLNRIGGSDSKSQALKGASEFGELCDAILKSDQPKIIDGIGDVVVVLTILAAQNGLKIEECIAAAYDEIKDRKGVMYNGAFIKSDDARYPAIVEAIATAAKG